MTAPDPAVPPEPSPDDDVIVRDGDGRLAERFGPRYWRIPGALSGRLWSEMFTDKCPPQVYVPAERLATAEAERDAARAEAEMKSERAGLFRDAYRDLLSGVRMSLGLSDTLSSIDEQQNQLQEIEASAQRLRADLVETKATIARVEALYDPTRTSSLDRNYGIGVDVWRALHPEATDEDPWLRDAREWGPAPW